MEDFIYTERTGLISNMEMSDKNYEEDKLDKYNKPISKPNNYHMVHDIDSTSTNEDDYSEPVFASILRSIGCFIGYTCIPVGGCGCCYPYKTVDKGSKAVIQEFGRFKREIGDGMHYVNPVQRH